MYTDKEYAFLDELIVAHAVYMIDSFLQSRIFKNVKKVVFTLKST